MRQHILNSLTQILTEFFYLILSWVWGSTVVNYVTKLPDNMVRISDSFQVLSSNRTISMVSPRSTRIKEIVVQVNGQKFTLKAQGPSSTKAAEKRRMLPSKRQEWILEKPKNALFSWTAIYILSIQWHYLYYTRHGTRTNSFGSVIFTLLQSWHLLWFRLAPISSHWPSCTSPGFQRFCEVSLCLVLPGCCGDVRWLPTAKPKWRAGASNRWL